MICYILAMGKQHLGPHVVVGYGMKIFWPGLFITSPDHLVEVVGPPFSYFKQVVFQISNCIQVVFQLKGSNEFHIIYVTLSAAFLWYRGKIVCIYAKQQRAQYTPLRHTAAHRQMISIIIFVLWLRKFSSLGTLQLKSRCLGVRIEAQAHGKEP